MNQKAGKIRKNADIELLRAVAILLTLIAHVEVLLPYESEFYTFLKKYLNLTIGVDLFFVISGFVITQSLAATKNEKFHGRKYLIQAFWIKRIFRLLPAAWLWLLIGAIFFMAVGTLSENYQPTIAALLNVINIYWAFCPPYGEASLICSGSWHTNSHYWSLSLEEQFYLVYPLLFFFVNRRLLIILLACFILMNLFWERPIFSTGWLMRLDAISWGVLLGLLYPREFYRKAAHILDSHRLLIFLVYIALVVALPMVAQQVLGMRSQDTAVFGVGLIAFLGAILVWLASYDLNLFNRWGYLRALMLYLGARSYSLYLSHLVVFRVLLYIYANNYETETFINHPVVTNSAILFSGLAIAVGTSELTYRYIETPFRRKGRTLAGQILEKGFLPTPSRPKIE